MSVHSGESLENLLSLLDVGQLAKWQTRPLLVPGERVGELAKQRGFNQVV